ncbi:unnamed protein product [Rotaria sp. Silwood2]|nr:unnamed protein product [Rotaria sp. Silwood2]CAF4471740.1 unnamed protein product [Rotaria sp. Silwood2]
MKRHDSKGSVTSMASSCRAGEKKIPPAHMIIQREHDNKLMLLPVAHAVNSSVTGLKVNNTTTFKCDLNNRKQERGRIIQLGSKEACTEQLQVFEMIADVDTNNTIDIENHEMNEQEEHEQQKKNPKKQSTMSVGARELMSKGSNTNSIVRSTNKPTNIPTQKKDMKAKRLQFDDEIDEASENEDESPCVVSKDSEQPIMSQKEFFPSSSSSTKGKKLLPVVSRKDGLSKVSTNKIIINPSSRNNENIVHNDTTVVDLGNSGEYNQRVYKYNLSSYVCYIELEEQLQEMSNTELLRKYQALSIKCKNLSNENIALQLECDRLTEENQILKTTTMPMPDAAGRQWFINTAQYLTSKVSNINIAKHARTLGMSAQDLISCIEDTTSNTARQIIRHLYPPEKLLTMTGSDVPADQRSAIRAFAELQRGPILTHKFNEAINGVFRSKKHEVKTKQEENESMNSAYKSKSNKKNNPMNKGQKHSKQMIYKDQHSQSNNITTDNENIDAQEDQSDIEQQ